MRIIRHPFLLGVLTAALFLLMQLVEFAYFRQLTGGIGHIDYRPLGFSTDDAVDWLNALGPGGSQAVLVWHYLTLDLVFPALFGLTLASLTLMASKSVPGLAAWPARARTIAAVVWVAPYVAVDYLQNLVVAGLLTDPTALDHTVVEVASALGIVKFLFAAIGIAMLGAMVWTGGRQP